MRVPTFVVLLIASGCVPYAYVLPPVDVAADVGPRGSPSVSAQVNVSVGVRPLALLPELHQRENDFTVGYVFTVTPTPSLHGPYVEYSRVLWAHPTEEAHLWRLRGGAVARLLYDTSVRQFGGAAAARVVIESSTFVDRDFESTDNSRGWLTGHALGELGLGLYAELGVVAVPSLLGWVASIGIIATIPASVGVGFAWLW